MSHLSAVISELVTPSPISSPPRTPEQRSRTSTVTALTQIQDVSRPSPRHPWSSRAEAVTCGS